MHRIARWWIAPVLLLAAALLATPLLTAPPPAAAAAATHTLTGSYLWEQGGDRGPLEAVFTPAGDLRWDVSFHFEHGGSNHTYTGTAEGHLDEGALSGKVQADRRRRTFTFRGEFKNGKFSGTHAEVMGNDQQRTGTFTMSPKS